MAAFAPPEELRQVEAELRQVWGGARVYVCKEPSAGKALRLATVLAGGGTVREAFRVAGCGSSWGYRLLRRRCR